MLSNLATQSYLSYKGLFHWLHVPGYVSNVFLRPMLMLALFALVGRFAADQETAQSYMLGMTVHSMAWLILGSVMQMFANDREYGTLSVNLASGANRLELYLVKMVMHWPNAILAIASALFFGWLFLDLDADRVHWGALILATIAVVGSVMAFSLFFGTSSFLSRNWVNIVAIGVGLLMGLTGIIVPTSSLPGFLSNIGVGLPLTHGLSAFRDAWAGSSVGDVLPDLWREWVVACAYAIAGYLLFRLLEVWVRRQGAFERSSV